jgi:hypothetical protein
VEMLLCKQNSRDIFVSEITANKNNILQKTKTNIHLKTTHYPKQKPKIPSPEKPNQSNLTKRNQNPKILKPNVQYPKNQIQISEKEVNQTKRL